MRKSLFIFVFALQVAAGTRHFIQPTLTPAQRREWASSSLEGSLLEVDHMDTNCRATGKDASTLTIKWVLMNRVWVSTSEAAKSATNSAFAHGFNKIIFTDGRKSWTIEK